MIETNRCSPVAVSVLSIYQHVFLQKSDGKDLRTVLEQAEVVARDVMLKFLPLQLHSGLLSRALCECACSCHSKAAFSSAGTVFSLVKLRV